MVFEKRYEWTVELHPTTCTPALLETLATLGVNRLSIGVQSFHDPTLLACNRRHTVAQAKAAITLARSIIPDTGIDLIAGLPGVDAAQWQATLETALAFDLPHLSIYALSIDEGSLWHRQGRQEPSPDLLCDVLASAEALLASAGLERYETSNYAKPGYRCQHNLNTWHGGDYLGLGEGAASRLGRRRRDGSGQITTLSPLDDALERALTHLRLNEGFSIAAILQRFPLLEPYRKGWEANLAFLQSHALLDAKGAPTTRGYEVLDALIRSFYDVVATTEGS
jgi:coproporphyrinogen III oxidase-like Fe-S oxidoreductase